MPPLNLPRVRPGDLITALQWNTVLDALDQLQAQIDALGGAAVPDGPPFITLLQPSDQPTVGSELLILGGGFGLAIENVVTIANLTAIVLGGGGTQLRVQVPTVPGVPPGGLQTQLTVSNPRGFAARALRVLPAILTVPEGQLFANMTQPPAGPLNAGASHVFIFTVQAVVNIAETYALTPLVTAESLPGQWQAEVLDAANSPITAITIPAGQPPGGESRQVRVRVTIPNGATGGSGATLSLTVRSQRNASLVATSPTFNLTVGGAPPAAEQLTVTRSGIAGGSVDPDGTVAARQPRTRVTYSVAGTQAGVAYTVDVGTVPANWTAQVMGGTAHTATGAQLTVRIDFTPGAGAGAATFNLRVSRSDDPAVFGTRQQAVRPE